MFYTRPPSLAEMRAGGYEPEDFDEVVEVWPENWPAFDLFARRLATQWTVGFNGRTGLRYEALYPLLDRMQLSAAEWDQMFDDIRHLESAALDELRKDQ